MTVNLSYLGGAGWQFFDNSGNPLAGGFLYVYAAGTTTPVTTYTTSAGNIANSNPIQLDSAGRVANEIWLTAGALYKFRLTDSTGSQIWEKDDMPAINDASASIYANLANTTDVTKGDALIGFRQSDPNGALLGAVGKTVHQKFQQYINVQDFGALGDGSGDTPNDTGDDISNAVWNTWDNTPWKDDPNYSPWWANPQGTFQPPRAKPFANDDTWDYIGCNLALWYAGASGKSTYFPAGRYLMNASGSTNKGYQGLFIMKGQEQTIYGEGPYRTTIAWKENATYFNNNNVGSIGYYKLFQMYRTGGPPSNVYNMAFSGPDNYSPTANNITLINCENINGVTFRDLWLNTGYYGISATTSSGDSHIKSVTAEFLFGAVVYIDASSELSMDFVNFWASTIEPTQRGVQALGRTSVTNSRFIEFKNVSIAAATGLIANNYFDCKAAGNVIQLTGDGLISGNQLSGFSQAAMINVVSNASITGNYFKQTVEHPIINLGNGSASSSSYVNITGNTFIKTNNTSAAQNYAIVAEVSNVNYTGGTTNTALIANNTFQGRALSTIGLATLINNIFSSVDGNIQSHGDIQGELILTGTDANASFTITVSSGLIGQGNGSVRDLERITLVNVILTANNLELRGAAIYSNRFNGNALLLGTLGTQAVGGTITFGASGANPTIAITNTTGNTANYRVTQIPLT